MSIGDTLAAGRQHSGLTITQVSDATRIRETIVRGIERDDFSGCGGDVYARGHIRSIARVVGADAEALVGAYDAQHGAPQAVAATDVFEPSAPIRLTGQRGSGRGTPLALALALLLGLAVYQLWPSGHAPPHLAQPAGQAQAGHHAPRPPAARSSARPATVIHLTARHDCWVQLRTSRGHTIYSGIVTAGTRRHWTERRAVRLRLGNPGGVALTVNGRKLRSRYRNGAPLTLRLRPGGSRRAVGSARPRAPH